MRTEKYLFVITNILNMSMYTVPSRIATTYLHRMRGLDAASCIAEDNGKRLGPRHRQDIESSASTSIAATAYTEHAQHPARNRTGLHIFRLFRMLSLWHTVPSTTTTPRSSLARTPHLLNNQPYSYI